VLDYIDNLDRADLAALTVTLGRWLSQLIHEKADSVTTEEQASQRVIAEARTFASEYALRLHAAQAEEERCCQAKSSTASSSSGTPRIK